MRYALIALTSLLALAQVDTIRTRVDLVVVPAAVRDAGGKLVNGLAKEDFVVVEDGREQSIQQFSTDPVPLSVAVVVDTGIGGTALRRVASSVSALSSAVIGDYDEAAVYRFNTSVTKLSEFTSRQATFDRSFDPIQKMAENKGDQSEQPGLIIAPGRGPRWLRWLLDRGAKPRVLNDALSEAANDLAKRKEENRKIIITISDGQVASSSTTLPWQKPPELSLNDARDRLVKDKIQVYAVSVGMGLLEGGSSILHTYAGATGGDVYGGRTQQAMESAFSLIAEEARYQYVLSYVSNNRLTGQLPVVRKIEVKTHNPTWKITYRKSYLQYPERQ
jgi:VWFA-related protein